ncbi:MAG: PQQ-dependent sugar dehydrogenase, partial [Chthoniobacteraceae bacterium]
MRRSLRFLLVGILCAKAAADFPNLALKPVSLGQMHSPTTIAHVKDGSGRLFVCDQPGIIYIIENGYQLPTPFLDIRSAANVAPDNGPGPVVTVNAGYTERGLLGMAFHPGFSDSGSPGFGKFYLNYSKPYQVGVDPGPPVPDHTPNHVTVIAEFQVSAGDPNVADPTERRLLVFTQPQSNHNGGQLEFGPDGKLYIGTGDGGSSNDNNVGHTGGAAARPTNGLGNGQDRTNYLGKILRIDPLDPDAAGPLTYSIPTDNPFFNDPLPGLKKEIFAYGLRNPWRFCFDARPGGTNRIFCGDVGQGRIEEINLIVPGGNYGWRYLEGDELPVFSSGAPTNPMPNPGGPFIAPIAVYAHPGVVIGNPPLPQLGLSVTGGYVYRGAAIPALRGKYVFGDYGSTAGASDGRMMGLEETAPGSGVFTLNQAIPLLGTNPIVGQRILTLGEDESGEIYIGLKSTPGVLQLDINGQPAGGIYQVVAQHRVSTTLQPSQDNTIFSDDVALARHYSDGRGYLYVGRTGPNWGPYVRRALVQFDVPGRVAFGSKVLSASLQLNFVKAGSAGSGKSIGLHRLTEPWGEGASENIDGKGFGAPARTGDATWFFTFFNTLGWGSPGGSFNSTASATAVVGSPGPMTWDSTTQLVADVQGWVDTTVNNDGWLLRGDENVNITAAQFDSKQSGSVPPQLTVTYDTASPPIVFVVPADIFAEATGTGGAVVNYTASAADIFGLSYSFTADQPSGATFPIGTTTVNLASSDGAGSIVTASFTVTVEDTTKPALTLPGPFSVEATGANGAVVNFNVSASDVVGVTSLIVTPASGSEFPIGPTMVNVSAMDAAGNEQTGSFTVTVQDTTKPALTLPG